MKLNKLYSVLLAGALVVPAVVSAKPVPRRPSRSNMLHYITVTSTPYLGKASDFNAADVISNFSGINTDLALLKVRQADEAKLGPASMLGSAGRGSWLQLSGSIMASVNAQNDVQGQDGYKSKIALGHAELDTAAWVSKWVSALVNVVYADSSAATDVTNGPANIVVKKAFITVGKLSDSPLYLSAGKMYVPFGRYSSAMVSDPMTKTLGRAMATAVLVGYSAGPLSAQAYAFGATAANDPTQGAVGQQGKYAYGINVSYAQSFGAYNMQLGAGLISNMSHSLGLSSNTQLGILPPNAAYDVNLSTKVDVGDNNSITMTAEYLSALNAYAKSYLAYDNMDQTPGVAHAELDYNFMMGSRKVTVGGFYSYAIDGAAIGFAKSSYGAVINSTIDKDLVLSLEYKYNKAYAADKYSTMFLSSKTALQKSGSEATMQLSLYF